MGLPAFSSFSFLLFPSSFLLSSSACPNSSLDHATGVASNAVRLLSGRQLFLRQIQPSSCKVGSDLSSDLDCSSFGCFVCRMCRFVPRLRDCWPAPYLLLRQIPLLRQ